MSKAVRAISEQWKAKQEANNWLLFNGEGAHSLFQLFEMKTARFATITYQDR